MAELIVDNDNKVFDSRDYCNAVIEKDTNRLLFGCSGTIIPASVTSINFRAFDGSGIKEINIPSGITSIEDKTFNGCASLSSVTIPDSVESIGANAFGHCGLTSIEIPNSVKKYLIVHFGATII